MILSKTLLTQLVQLSSLADEITPQAITYDSRKVTEGTLFVAIKGFATDGHRFINQALIQGALAIVSEEDPQINTPWIQVKNVRKAMAQLAFEVYRVSLDTTLTVGITGTNGKTTIATLLDQLFRHFFTPSRCWRIGTAGNLLGETLVEAQRTTPECVDLLEWISKEPAPLHSLVMEVSSHALVLERLEGINFTYAIFTNLTQDHLDFHHTMEEYYQAKKRLFVHHLRRGGRAIINIDDSYGYRLFNELDKSFCYTYGTHSEATFRILDIHAQNRGTFFRLAIDNKKYKISSPLVGTFNVYNLTALLAVAYTHPFDFNKVISLIPSLKSVPGRMEIVSLDHASFSVIVDYAHTPDALKNVLMTAQRVAQGRVIAVFGAGGDRDRLKRPRMAEVVAKNAHQAIITSDNPRSESPQQILADIEAGMPLDFPYECIEDRAKAIAQALTIACDGDTIIIAGKGHETYQEISGIKHHFDDREEARNAWALIKKQRGL